MIDISSFFTEIRAEHDVETAILRKSKETYREAYDVLVKTNRFVKITSSRGLPVRPAVAGQALPMIAIQKDIVDKFKGYVLSVHVGFKEPREIPTLPDPDNMLEPVTAMILHSDLGRFCKALNDGDLHDSSFSESVKLIITMAPVLDTVKGNTLSPNFESFFTKKMQKILFMPLITTLFGYKAVEINGHVDRALAATVRQDLAQDRYSNPAAVLAEFTAAKEDGSRLFRDKNVEEACIGWQDAVYDMEKLLESSSWPGLVRRGGDQFVSQVAPLYFLMQLNIAHVQIANMQTMSFGADVLAEGALNSAVRSMTQGFWKLDFKYRPSTQQLAKLRYRYAMFMRLEGDPKNADRALRYIEGGLRLQPGDAALMREREHILAWIQQL